MKTKNFKKIAKDLKESLIQDICEYLACPKPNGGWKCYPALFIAPKGLYIRTRSYLAKQKIIAIIPGYVITKSKIGRIDWNEMVNLPIETLLTIQTWFESKKSWEILKPQGKFYRIFDPFWFMIPDKANENLKKVLSETQEHYIQSFAPPKDEE